MLPKLRSPQFNGSRFPSGADRVESKPSTDTLVLPASYLFAILKSKSRRTRSAPKINTRPWRWCDRALVREERSDLSAVMIDVWDWGCFDKGHRI